MFPTAIPQDSAQGSACQCPPEPAPDCLISSFPAACESVADTVFNAVWTLGCRPFMNSQRSACICSEEERDELWSRAEPLAFTSCCQRSLSHTALLLSDFQQPSGQAWDTGTLAKQHALAAALEQKAAKGEAACASRAEMPAVLRSCSYTALSLSSSIRMIWCQFSLQTDLERQAGRSAGYKQGALLVCLPLC